MNFCMINFLFVILSILITQMFYRYLKNVFPKVDEYILLDTLEQYENNVQKATDKLLELGYEKRNPTAPSRLSIKKKDDDAVNK
jgi:hypothetical protein